jgi:predicted helicase
VDKATIQKIFKTYLSSIQGALQKGDAGEQTHYSALKALIESLFPGITATITPKGIQDDAKESIKPDFRITRGDIPLGHIEAKDIGADLNAVQKTEQLKRYFKALPSVMLTNFLEFRWYVDGELRDGRDGYKLAVIDTHEKILTDADRMEKTYTLLAAFLEHHYPSVGTPQELAERMARLAHLCREMIVETFRKEGEIGSLHTQLEAFRENIIPDLKPEEFADMYAQTFSYGLFAARCECENSSGFTRRDAAYLIPKTNPFLRNFFNQLAGPNLDGRIEWIVEDLVELLRRADMAEVLRDFGKRTRKEDPVVHFYETFLKAYDPKVREMRGVYYTPLPVVNYIVRAIDHTLKTEFNRPEGLADPTVFILDPACGTSTFLYEVVKHIHDYIQEQGQGGTWDGYVEKYLLPRLFGFELLMAPYAIAHLKLTLLLKELGYTFKGNERLNIFLTNTLEEAMKKSQTLFAKFISDEANMASAIKRDMPIMVVLGNPPYSGISANRGKWITKLLKEYYQVDGQPLGEKKIWLQDDYVKFIRFAQWRIEQTGYGIVGLITNHGYLDNVGFRGMRQSLMHAFDQIDVLDLHGNAKKKEVAPDGSKDENVFDIQQGVAIGLFTRLKERTGKCRVRHGDLWGKQEEKYHALMKLGSKSRHLATIKSKSPSYYFIPRDERGSEEYETYWPVPQIFGKYVTGVVTARDAFVIDLDKKSLQRRIEIFRDAELGDREVQDKFSLAENYAWRVAAARKELIEVRDWKKHFKEILYRPFDIRHIYYHPSVVWRTRENIMRHMLEGENLGLITTRQTRDKWDSLATRSICAHKSCAAYDINYLFPLYLYPKEENGKNGNGGGNGNGYQMMIAEPKAKYGARGPNLNPAFVREMAAALKMDFVEDGKGDLKKTFGPEDVFDYIYAIFHSPTYRTRYAEFLKSDFPRVPLPTDAKQFKKLASLGEELVALHLLESPDAEKFITKYDTRGKNLVEQVRYVDVKKRVYISNEQFFEGVPKDVWEFQIGGYQVCEKWLKDRKGRELTVDEIKHYQRIVKALYETIRLMKEIDAV